VSARLGGGAGKQPQAHAIGIDSGEIGHTMESVLLYVRTYIEFL